MPPIQNQHITPTALQNILFLYFILYTLYLYFFPDRNFTDSRQVSVQTTRVPWPLKPNNGKDYL